MKRALIVLTATLAIAGCGGGGGAGRASAPEKTERNEQSVASTSALTVKDLPAGWRLEESDDSDDRTCPAFAAAEDATTGRSPILTFDTGEEGTSILLHRVYVFADAKEAARVFAEFEKPEMGTCFGEQFAAGAGEEADVGKVKTEPVKVAQPGEGTTATRVTLPAKAEGTTIDLLADWVLTRAGRSISLLGFIDVEDPFDEQLRDTLIKTSVDRLT